MLDVLALEAERLALADRHIADGERHVSAQAALIERLRAAGADTVLAERLLISLQGALEQHHEHRRLILEHLALARTEPT